MALPGTASQALFDQLIDYAGLFAPASLSMQDAVAEYEDALAGPHVSRLGRFICLTSRLEELGESLIAAGAGGEAWNISVIVDGEAAAAAYSIHAFSSSYASVAAVVLLEAELPSTSQSTLEETRALVAPFIKATMAASSTATPFFEIVLAPEDDDSAKTFTHTVAALIEGGESYGRSVGGKLRCGGADAAAFPSSAIVAGFISACTIAALPFKFTAGLHHPLRHFDPELGVMRHGFLNLLVASVAAQADVDTSALEKILDDTDPASFRVTSDAFSWQDQQFSLSDGIAGRESFTAYGSCSFDEPTTDLLELRMISL